MSENTPFSDIYLTKTELNTLKSFLKYPEKEYSDKLNSLISNGFIKDKGKIVNGYLLSSGIYIITQRGKNYIKYTREHSASSIILILTLIFSILAVVKEELMLLLQLLVEKLP